MFKAIVMRSSVAVDQCSFTTIWCETGFNGRGLFQTLRGSAEKIGLLFRRILQPAPPYEVKNNLSIGLILN